MLGQYKKMAILDINKDLLTGAGSMLVDIPLSLDFTPSRVLVHCECTNLGKIVESAVVDSNNNNSNGTQVGMTVYFYIYKFNRQKIQIMVNNRTQSTWTTFAKKVIAIE